MLSCHGESRISWHASVTTCFTLSAFPEANRTSDSRLCELSESDHRLLISKDADFVDSFLLQRKPPQLLHVSTGNITNVELEALFRNHEAGIVEAFRHARHVELCRRGLIVHE